MRRLIVVTAVVLLAGSPASAQFLEQFEESLWGVQASLTPEWRSADLVRRIFGFEKFDLSGVRLYGRIRERAHAVGTLGTVVRAAGMARGVGVRRSRMLWGVRLGAVAGSRCELVRAVRIPVRGRSSAGRNAR